MPLRINERSITSNFLPSVYIERITLESSTIAPPMHNLDPHIKNIYEGERLPEYLKENVEISEVAAKSAREQSLKVSLDLSIKQKITNIISSSSQVVNQQHGNISFLLLNI